MSPDDLVVTDLRGQKLSGRGNPSSEIGMHLLIYQRRPDVNAVCHAHPPVATGFAASSLPLNKAILSELVLSLGCVPVARYGTPGTPELAEAIEPLVQSYDAILMANLLTAFFRMETTEHFARVTLVTKLLGKQVLLSGGDVEKLLAARARYGLQTAATVGPECPVTSDNAATERITLTRRELEALVDEEVQKALEKDRQKR